MPAGTGRALDVGRARRSRTAARRCSHFDEAARPSARGCQTRATTCQRPRDRRWRRADRVRGRAGRSRSCWCAHRERGLGEHAHTSYRRGPRTSHRTHARCNLSLASYAAWIFRLPLCTLLLVSACRQRTPAAPPRAERPRHYRREPCAHACAGLRELHTDEPCAATQPTTRSATLARSCKSHRLAPMDGSPTSRSRLHAAAEPIGGGAAVTYHAHVPGSRPEPQMWIASAGSTTCSLRCSSDDRQSHGAYALSTAAPRRACRRGRGSALALSKRVYELHTRSRAAAAGDAFPLHGH